MPQLSVDLQVLRDALLDRSLSQVGDSLLEAKVTSPITLGDVALTPSTQLAVRVLNRPEDKDEDAVFGDGHAPHIAFNLQSAWIKYKLSAKAVGATKIAVAAAKAGGDLSLADYRIHRPTERAFAAMTRDLDAPRSLLSLDDVKKLAPGEALALEIGGSLSASVTVAWSDILGAKLPALLSELPERLPVAVKVKSGLGATASVRVADQFSVVISRTPEGPFRIAVKKARSSDHTFGLELEAGLDASAVQAIVDALEPAFDALVEAAEGRDVILRQIESLKSTVRSRLDAFFRWKAMAGFAYEYARIDERTAIADYLLLDDGQLADDHARAIAGDWAHLAAALRTDVGSRAIVRYLNETTLTRRSSFGFSLGIGKWLEIKARDQSVFSQTTRTSLDGFRLITSKGTRRYDEKKIPQNDFTWIVDLKAQMHEFLETPTSRDFDYGLHYAVMLERTALSANDIERILDFASMWDVCAPDPSMFAEAIGQKGTLRVQMLFERDELEATLAAFGDLEGWAEPLGAAMPYMSSFSERRTHAARASIYSPAWEHWLAGSLFSAGDWAALLRPSIRSGLFLLEERALPASFAWTIGHGHPQLRSRLGAFVRGARALHNAMTTEQNAEAIGEAYALLQRFWSQRLYVAASGRYLIARAKAAGVTPNVTLQVEFADETITS